VFEVLDLVEETLAGNAPAPRRYEFPRGRVGDGSSQGTGSTQ